jgi:hypothetical protein
MSSNQRYSPNRDCEFSVQRGAAAGAEVGAVAGNARKGVPAGIVLAVWPPVITRREENRAKKVSEYFIQVD